jgi:hypothetical protein
VGVSNTLASELTHARPTSKKRVSCLSINKVLAQFWELTRLKDSSHLLPQERILHNEQLVVPVGRLEAVALPDPVVPRKPMGVPEPSSCGCQRSRGVYLLGAWGCRRELTPPLRMETI